MHQILEYYGGLPKLKLIVQSFRKTILSTLEVKHFLFTPNFDKLYADQVNYLHYVFPRSDREYKEPIRQTSSDDYKIPTWQYDQVVQILQKILRDEFGVLENDIVRMSAHILELIEESRAQSDDMNSHIWKPADVSLLNIKKFYETNGHVSKLDYDANEVKVVDGLSFPISAKIIPRDKVLQLNAISTHDAGLPKEEVNEIAELLSQKFSRLTIETTQNGKNASIIARHNLPYENYVPKRLFLRLTKKFAEAFVEVHEYYKAQSAKIISEGLNIRREKNILIIDQNKKSDIYKQSPLELIKDLKDNRVDEMLVLALFENHYNVLLEILHTDVNRYICKVKDKTYSYEFHQLKSLLINKIEKKLSEQ